MTITSINPFIAFNTEAEDAANLYVSLFPNSKINQISRYGDAGPGPKGGVMVVSMDLMGQRITAMNGGPQFQLTHAFSLMVNCTEQAEIDRLWDALGEGGKYNVCGWLTDRFGLTWQINYAGIPDLMTGPTAGKVMAAMMGMAKIDIQGLKDAAK